MENETWNAVESSNFLCPCVLVIFDCAPFQHNLLKNQPSVSGPVIFNNLNDNFPFHWDGMRGGKIKILKQSFFRETSAKSAEHICTICANVLSISSSVDGARCDDSGFLNYVCVEKFSARVNSRRV